MKAKEYFVFTKRERSGIISLIILVLIVVVIPKYFDHRQPAAEKITVTNSIDTIITDTITKEGIARPYKKFKPPRHVKKRIEPFDINSADTSAFIELPGIGRKLAARIVLFREKLGGFYNVQQLREVYGVQDSVYRKIAPFLICTPGNVKKIDINNAEKETLKVHPYIRWQMANALVAYRDQHGAFHSEEDLLKLENIDGDALKKMIPYISFK
jgi:DNA uptake protein ComE-like DNA-binding protein